MAGCIMALEKSSASVAQPSASQLRLILSAEWLFADLGIEGASLRQIAEAAGQANNAAVQYHFGSRENLVAAIFAYRVSQLDVLRGKMLAQLTAAGAQSDLHALLRILFLPQLALVNDEGVHPYARFLVQYISRYRPLGVAHTSDTENGASKHLRTLVEMIRHRLHHIPRELLSRRLETVNLAFANMIVTYDIARAAARPVTDFRMQIDDMIEVAVSALSAPLARRADLFPSPDATGGVPKA
jgi:AcrR family transcriptional regulator